MSDEKPKLEPPLHLDMPFDEALARYAQTKAEEVEPPKGKGPKVAKAAKRLSQAPIPSTSGPDKEWDKRK